MMDIIASQSWAYIPDLPDDIGPIRNLLLVYSRIPASDIDSHILRVDQDEFGATFVVGDMLDPDDTRLDDLLHKVTIIYAGSFFHLFSWTQQVYIGKRLVGFLKRGTKNALIYGRHIGTTRPGPSPLGNDMSPYLHDKDSFQRLWDEVGHLTNTKWAVEIEPAGEKIVDVPRIDRDAQPVNFVIHQIS
ncbi:hypothetical protein MANI_013367 [Metarhizium anisopliae]|nr:hypothetical protein MANI_013367 [Metarhizium anisopliae]